MHPAPRARRVVAGLGALSLVGYGAGFAWVAANEAAWPTRHVALFASLFLLYLVAARVVWRAPACDRVLLGLILGFGLAFRLLMLPTPAVLSSDVHRYLWDGRVQWAGVSPYRYPPAAPELADLRDAATHPRINRPDKRTIYPPGAQMLFAAVAGVAPGSLLAWRLVLLGCEVVTTGLLLGLLRRTGVVPAAVILYACVAREAVRGVAMLALAAALAGALGWIARVRTENPPGVLGATLAAVGAYLLLVPSAMHAWYATWIVPFLAARPSPAWLWFSGAVALSYLKYGSASGALPLWARLVEYLPLYALLVWEWRTGRLAVGGRADAATWRPGAATVLPSAAR